MEHYRTDRKICRISDRTGPKKGFGNKSMRQNRMNRSIYNSKGRGKKKYGKIRHRPGENASSGAFFARFSAPCCSPQDNPLASGLFSAYLSIP
jgi:hypothetical protein